MGVAFVIPIDSRTTVAHTILLVLPFLIDAMKINAHRHVVRVDVVGGLGELVVVAVIIVVVVAVVTVVALVAVIAVVAVVAVVTVVAVVGGIGIV